MIRVEVHSNIVTSFLEACLQQQSPSYYKLTIISLKSCLNVIFYGNICILTKLGNGAIRAE